MSTALFGSNFIRFYFINKICDLLVQAQSELAESDELNLKAIEDIQADIVKSANEIAIIQAGFDNQLNELQVNRTFDVHSISQRCGIFSI